MEWVTPFISGRNDSATIAILTPPTVVGTVGLAGSNGWPVEEEWVNRWGPFCRGTRVDFPYPTCWASKVLGVLPWLLLGMVRARLKKDGRAHDGDAGQRPVLSPSVWGWA
ncbi:hypothetical protein GCM10010523_17790 [Paenarthrobacter ilicis]